MHIETLRQLDYWENIQNQLIVSEPDAHFTILIDYRHKDLVREEIYNNIIDPVPLLNHFIVKPSIIIVNNFKFTGLTIYRDLYTDEQGNVPRKNYIPPKKIMAQAARYGLNATFDFQCKVIGNCKVHEYSKLCQLRKMCNGVTSGYKGHAGRVFLDTEIGLGNRRTILFSQEFYSEEI